MFSPQDQNYELSNHLKQDENRTKQTRYKVKGCAHE